MSDLYLHCKFQYNVAFVVGKYSSIETPQDDVDFVTGLLSVSDEYLSEYYDFGTANGTTITSSASADDTVLTIASSTGMTVGERISVELDNGLRHVTFLSAVNSATEIEIADGLSSAAASSNNVVTASQLEGTTDGTLSEDFKQVKSLEIQKKSQELLEVGYDYNGQRFPLSGVNDPSVRTVSLFSTVLNDRTSSNLTITNISQANPAIVTVSSMEDMKTFDTIAIASVSGMTEVNGNLYTIGNVTGSTFELLAFSTMEDIDSTGFTAYTSGGICVKQEAAQNQPILDDDGHAYLLADNAEFTDLAQAASGRRNYIFGASGQTGLLAQVSLAANTQAAMDAIVDGR